MGVWAGAAEGEGEGKVGGQPAEAKAGGTADAAKYVAVTGGAVELGPHSIAFVELAGERTCERTGGLAGATAATSRASVIAA